jgi:hypothetical protein
MLFDIDNRTSDGFYDVYNLCDDSLHPPSPTISCAPCPALSWWETHAGSTIGGLLSFFGAVVGGWIAVFGVFLRCLAQWRVSELRESLNNPNVPMEVQQRRMKILEEHYALLERGGLVWCWHQQPKWVQRLLSILAWSFYLVGGLLVAICKNIACILCVFGCLWNLQKGKPRAGHPDPAQDPNAIKLNKKRRRVVSANAAEQGQAGT